MLAGLLKRFSRRTDDNVIELARAVRKLAEVERERAALLAAQVSDVTHQVAQRATAKDANEILHAVRAATVLLEKVGADGGDASDAKLFQTLDGIAKGARPIVVGPWTGEVGFELLYWIPFVEWFKTRWRIAEDRLVIISRGGTDAWYGMPAARYSDIFTVMPADDFRARTDPHAHKQRDLTSFEQGIVDDVSGRLGLSDAAILHPRLMYRLFGPYWRDEAGFSLVDRFTSHRRIAAAADPVVDGLPENYVAVRFYFSDCFPETAANRAFAQRVIAAIARQTPVVLLNPGVRVDDHADAEPSGAAPVVSLAGRLTPERNLAAQTAVIARASCVVGTYGGYSYLGPLCGVPSVGFYSDNAFKLHHLAAAQRIFEQLGAPPVVALDTGHADAVCRAVGGLKSGD